MEKRRLTSLRSVLLQYLVRTALACLLVAVGWLLVLMLWIQNGGLFLPANQAAQACQKAAQDVLPGMTAATFDETQLDSLCRYALFAAPDSSEVLATNMDAGHLQRAMENRQGKTRWHFGYTQYYMTSKLQDGTVCLLQFDYAVPYADPALRGVLPDMQTVHCILGILLLVGAVVWSTRRTGRFLTRETEKLTAAAQAVARKELDSAVFSGAKVREYESTLQALQTMGDALTGSLQKQWAMEQRQREQIIQLSHKLKTPLTIIEGNNANAVNKRVLAVNDRFIRGFGVPDYASKADGAEPQPEPAPEPTPQPEPEKPAEETTVDPFITKTAREVIAGKWGNGQARKDALAAWFTKAVQDEVNRLLA